MTAPELVPLPGPPSVIDMRAAAGFTLFFTFPEPEELIHAQWRLIESCGREAQVLAGLGAILHRLGEVQGGRMELIDHGLQPGIRADLKRVAGYVQPLMAGRMGVASVPAGDRLLLAAMMARMILGFGPDIPDDLRECLADPEWPVWDTADTAAMWYGMAGRLS